MVSTDGRTDRRTDTEGYNIIPRHTLVAGYKKSYRTVIDFNFGGHEDLSILKSDIHLGLAASVNYHFFRYINPHVYLNEINNCISFRSLSKTVKK